MRRSSKPIDRRSLPLWIRQLVKWKGLDWDNLTISVDAVGWEGGHPLHLDFPRRAARMLYRFNDDKKGILVEVQE